MKIVQTLWTKPGLNAGWIDRRFHFISWALSCLQLCKYYDEVELYTDSEGKRILIDELKLPYTKVHVVLDDFSYPTYLWAIPKIFTYSLQEKPFLHIDGDVFIWEPLDERQTNMPFVFQNLEIEKNVPSFYTAIFKDLLSKNTQPGYWPDWIERPSWNNITAFNAGVFGGTDIDFIRKHAKAAFGFIDQYADDIARMIKPQNANHLAEQVLSKYLADQWNITTSSILPPQYFRNPDATILEYAIIDQFGISPHGKKYLHLVGEFKQTLKICKDLSRSIYAHYPEYYERVLNTFQPDYYKAKQYALAVGEGDKPDQAVEMPFDEYEPFSFSEHEYSIQTKSNKLKPNRIFYRTIRIYQYLTQKELGISPYLPTQAFKESLNQEINAVEDKGHQERIQDLFHYELAKYSFALEARSDKYYQDKENDFAQLQNQIYALLASDQLENMSFQFNKDFEIHYSKWDWKKRTKEEFMDNLRIEPENAKTIFIPEAITASVIEYDVSAINYIVLYSFYEPITFKEGFDLVCQYIDGDPSEEFKASVTNSLIHLVKDRVLLCNGF
ncbi:MAG TPA: hypothetical protein PKA00_05310 [Saprospiraceae bacterium]|nr:hypothetical protein [Saprospiraceae bacterium]HMQ82300.1 hypothetical protein [Saprospiraceae bacterium]